MIGLVGHELEKTLAEDDASKMALHYSVKTLLSTIRQNPDESFDHREAGRLVEDLHKFLDASGSEDDDPGLRRNVAEIRQILGSPRHAVS